MKIDCMKTVSQETDKVSKVTEQDSVTIPEWHHSLLLGDTNRRQGEHPWESTAPRSTLPATPASRA